MEYRLDNLTDECPVMVTKLPKEIMEEIDSWVDYCREIKSHPLFMLRNHENYGVNSYQLSIPPRMLQESFWLALTLRMTAALCGGSHRDYKIRTWDGHFDGFDVSFDKSGINWGENNALTKSNIEIFIDLLREELTNSQMNFIAQCENYRALDKTKVKNQCLKQSLSF